MILYKNSSKEKICSKIEVAKSFVSRTKGLIGTHKLEDAGLWIERCYWIHTFFMSIEIDALYIDQQMKIRKIDHSLKPWRIPAPVLGAKSVIELPAGLAKAKKLEIGDQLYVGH